MTVPYPVGVVGVVPEGPTFRVTTNSRMVSPTSAVPGIVTLTVSPFTVLSPDDQPVA